MSEKLNILEGRKDNTRTGVYVYLEKEDVDKLIALVNKTHTNRSDVMRQALKMVYKMEIEKC